MSDKICDLFNLATFRNLIADTIDAGPYGVLVFISCVADECQLTCEVRTVSTQQRQRIRRCFGRRKDDILSGSKEGGRDTIILRKQHGCTRKSD